MTVNTTRPPVSSEQQSAHFIVTVAWLCLIAWTTSRVTLSLYTVATFPHHGLSLWLLLKAWAMGVWFDLATLAYLIAPCVLARALIPQRWRLRSWRSVAQWVALWLICYVVLFGVVAEWVFWQEFTTRFNFIAVDYLVYTHEVIGNIVESYPLAWLLSGIALVATGVMMVLNTRLRWSMEADTPRKRVVLILMACALPLVATLLSRVDQMEFSSNPIANELAGNGLFTFSAAARRNELPYEQFYLTLPQNKADSILQGLGVQRHPLSALVPALAATASPEEPPHSAKLKNDSEGLGPLLKRPKNIVLISVESLSASYLGAYGSQEGLSPEMDKLMANGLKFEHMLATGTRTVRGLEALSLGIPPIPGQSVVHRPNNEHLATLGELLEAQGFATYFIYGGYGVFDNMNAYFRGNDYRIVDRTDFDPKTIVQENVWGVADESLFNNSLALLDQAQKTQKPFFAHIMTTSNHRPFTYPEGRIDIAPGHRQGAVKYTDYAIGQFIRQASHKPWFKDTLFVVVADHCASSAGKTKLPVDKYHIAAFLYNPNIVPASTYPQLASQIDLAPTLIDILGIKGREHFFGHALFREYPSKERAFISNYQELGYLKDNTLIVLSPKQQSQAYAVDPVTLESKPTAMNTTLLDEAIAYYQTAAASYKQGALSEFAPN